MNIINRYLNWIGLKTKRGRVWYYGAWFGWFWILFFSTNMTRGFSENPLYMKVWVIVFYIVLFFILSTIFCKTVTSVWALIKRVVKPNEQGGKS
jgi:hypothetical protein